jgi:DNA (cytosine-5)-methyltransferase 1
LLNAADFGAPQRRVRCFIIGVRHGVAPQFPAPTHGGNGLFSGQPHFTLGEFLSKDAEQDESKFVYPTEALGRELAKLPNGSGLKSAGVAEPTRPGGHWGYRQGTFIADLTKPARTVTGSASQDWVRWNGVLRRLTFSEVVKLQGFPPDWNFCGNSAQIFKQVGNAVPPIFGEMLGKVLRAHLDQNSSSPPQRNELPTSFTKYVEYTVADERKNGSARRVHKAFEGSKR